MVVYPRWRGELFCALAFCWLSRGLSPLARGTLCRCQHCWRVIRFIPAGAGNTVPRIISLSSSTVYPRWRGEHVGRESFDCPYIGLSPLARGTHQRYRLQLTGSRFIPAGAGNTGKTNIGVRVVPVYPRWRGEHSIRRFCSSSDAGLSPLARGTRCSVNIDGDVTRFIPAGAGNTAADSRAGHHRPVYPRWRGEHQLSDVSLAWRHGLSPLARGTPVHIRFLVARSRFIPAGAGNTAAVYCQCAAPAVYPRWRGEHSKHNLLLINDFLSQSQSTNFIVSHKQHIHYVKEYLIH